MSHENESNQILLKHLITVDSVRWRFDPLAVVAILRPTVVSELVELVVFPASIGMGFVVLRPTVVLELVEFVVGKLLYK